MFGYVHRLIYMRLRSRTRTGSLFSVSTSDGIFFLSLARHSHHYCYYLFTAVFRNEKQTHIHTHTQATRAINMKYCLIEDIVLKTLPRAFFSAFFYYSLFIYYFPPPTHRSSGSLIVYTLSRRTLLGTTKKKKK